MRLYMNTVKKTVVAGTALAAINDVRSNGNGESRTTGAFGTQFQHSIMTVWARAASAMASVGRSLSLEEVL